MERPADSNIAFEVLAYDECIRLLARAQVGRLAWVHDGKPMVVPVNFAWDGEAVVIRTDPGAKLRELIDAEAVFEIDEIDVTTHTGWSVVVAGRAQEVTAAQWPATAAAMESLGLVTWAPGSKNHWVRLMPHNVTGRRLRAAPDPAHNPFWRLSASE